MKLSVSVLWEIPLEDGEVAIAVENLVSTLNKSLEHPPFLHLTSPMELSLHLVGDHKMKALNDKYRQRASTTDVLSFPVHEDLKKEEKPLPLVNLGDIMISLPQAEKQAKDHRITVSQEVLHLTVHGFLHLLGFDHKLDREATQMENLERQLIDNMTRRTP